MRDYDAIKQVYYVETEEEFKLFMIIGQLVYYCLITKDELLSEKRGIEDTELAREFAIEAFKQTYIRDGIKLEEFYIPKLIASKDFEVKFEEEQLDSVETTEEIITKEE